MKIIELRQIKDEAKSIDFDYRKTLLTIAAAPIGGQGGVSVAEMRRALKVTDKLEAAKSGDKVELEDAEHEFLAARVQAWPWPNAHRVFIEFVDAVEKAPSKSDMAGTEDKTAGAKAG